MRIADDSSACAHYPTSSPFVTYLPVRSFKPSLRSTCSHFISNLDVTQPQLTKSLSMEISRWLLLQFINLASCSGAAIFGRVVPPFLCAETTSRAGCRAWTLPPLNPPVSNCASQQLSRPFLHNNSIVAPGASCHPGLSSVLLLLSLLD